MGDFILYLCNFLGVIIPLTLALTPGKNVPNWIHLATNTPWSNSSNFWQIMLTEYFVQIYNTFELWEGWTHQYEHSPKVTTFQNTIISQGHGNLFFWLISHACQGPDSPAQSPPSLAIPQEPISPSPEPPIHAQSWLWTSWTMTPTRRTMYSLCPGKCPMARTGAAQLPGWLLGWGALPVPPHHPKEPSHPWGAANQCGAMTVQMQNLIYFSDRWLLQTVLSSIAHNEICKKLQLNLLSHYCRNHSTCQLHLINSWLKMYQKYRGK